MPKVTVLMAVFNAEKYLREAVESILNQTFKDFEFLIVYDKSSDRSLEILRSYNDPRIKIIENPERLGLIRSLNKGLSIAQGEFIARMDSDDISRHDRLAVEFECLKENPWLHVVCSWTDVIDETGKVVTLWHSRSSPEDIYYTLNFRNCIENGTSMFRKSILEEVGNYDETNIVEDYYLWYRISKKFRIGKIDKPLYMWRTHDTSFSFVNFNKQNEGVYRLFRANSINLLKRNIEDKFTRLMWDNFCCTHYANFNDYSYEELLIIAELIRKLNDAIIDIAPKDLNKKQIMDLANEKYISFVLASSRKLGFFKTLELILSVGENALYRLGLKHLKYKAKSNIQI